MLDRISNYNGQLTWKIKKNLRIGSVTDFLMYLETVGNQIRKYSFKFLYV